MAGSERARSPAAGSGPVRLIHVLTVPDSLVFLRGQMRFMKARGFEITVVCSGGRGLEEFAEEEGVDFHTVEMPRRVTPVEDARAVATLTALFHGGANNFTEERLCDQTCFRVLRGGRGDWAPTAANYIRAINSFNSGRAPQFRQNSDRSVDPPLATFRGRL